MRLSVSKQVTTYDEVLKVFLRTLNAEDYANMLVYYRRELKDFRHT